MAVVVALVVALVLPDEGSGLAMALVGAGVSCTQTSTRMSTATLSPAAYENEGAGGSADQCGS